MYGVGTHEIEQPVAHQADGHRKRTQMVRLRLGHDWPRRHRPSKRVESDIKINRDNRDIRRGNDTAVGMDLEVRADKEHAQRLADSTPDEQGLAAELFNTEGEDECGHDDFDDSVDSGAEQVRGGAFHAEGLEDLGGVVVHRVDTRPLLECHPTS